MGANPLVIFWLFRKTKGVFLCAHKFIYIARIDKQLIKPN
jgi:hypothetical protein